MKLKRILNIFICDFTREFPIVSLVLYYFFCTLLYSMSLCMTHFHLPLSVALPPPLLLSRSPPPLSLYRSLSLFLKPSLSLSPHLSFFLNLSLSPHLSLSQSVSLSFTVLIISNVFIPIIHLNFIISGLSNNTINRNKTNGIDDNDAALHSCTLHGSRHFGDLCGHVIYLNNCDDIHSNGNTKLSCRL